MQKIISFSLWGDNPKYTIGAIKNAHLAKTIYSGWICRFYVDKSVPEDIVVQLRSCDNTELVEMDEEGDWRGMFWRFFAADDPHAIVISRDTDSRLSMREKAAVDAWLASDKDFHIMRDHPSHRARILGGMWGAKNGILSGIIIKRISKYKKENFWQIDQNFLADRIYPLIKKKALVHDTFLRESHFHQNMRIGVLSASHLTKMIFAMALIKPCGITL